VDTVVVEIVVEAAVVIEAEAEDHMEAVETVVEIEDAAKVVVHLMVEGKEDAVKVEVHHTVEANAEEVKEAVAESVEEDHTNKKLLTQNADITVGIFFA